MVTEQNKMKQKVFTAKKSNPEKNKSKNITITVGLFVCLFVWGLSSNSKIFHSYGDASITGEGLQILTYARHSCLAVELSLPVLTT